ncbi:hypothetical protein AK85_06600 [Streptococcus pneumoniae B1598]|nr:hypothetical protein AK85_06600 [Streptococcus pneumoniae B1598]
MQLLEKKELTKISISELVKRAVFRVRPFIAIMTPKEEILESVFKRTVPQYYGTAASLRFKDRPLFGLGSPFPGGQRKEARVIQLALDYHLEKIFVQGHAGILEKYHGKSKRCQLVPHAILDPF